MLITQLSLGAAYYWAPNAYSYLLCAKRYGCGRLKFYSRNAAELGGLAGYRAAHAGGHQQVVHVWRQVHALK